ncbi:MAG TPA: zinc-binding dehydrogenase [Anaerolineales bacterium]|nr:zinc-binding dehydrogenase [Anaerolineales bacterium]
MNPSIPSTMQAVQLDEPHGRLTLREVRVPRPGAGQVLIRMTASPINPSDLGSLSGFSYSGTRQFPFTPGLEGSGTVVEAGEGFMPRLLNGRRVACTPSLMGDGTWAEYMVTSAKSCVPLNRNVSLQQGAMMLVNPLSALAFFEIAERGKHRAIVNTAATSALGGMILRMGKRRGIPIIHVVRRQEQVDLIREQGGEYVFNSSEADFPEQLRTMVHRLQATLLLDAIGGSMTKALGQAAPYGSTILLYARLSAEDSLLDARAALAKQLHFDGWFLGNWMREKNLIQTLRLARQAQSLLGTDLSTPVQKRLPLSAAQQGLEMYTRNMGAGKILLVANPQEVNLEG